MNLKGTTEAADTISSPAQRHMVASKKLETIATDQFEHQLGQSTFSHTDKPAGVIREYVPRNLKRYKAREKTGEWLMEMNDDRRANPQDHYEDI
jgi:hypothetical protein